MREIDRLGWRRQSSKAASFAGAAGLMSRFPFIGDVRGKASCWRSACRSRDVEPLPVALNAHTRLVDIAYDRAIIYSRRTRGGRIGDHFMVCPPLIIDDQQVEELIAILTDSLDAFAAETGVALRAA